MDTAADIVNALTRIQERSNILRHGRSEVPEGLNLAEAHCIHWIGTLPAANVTRIASQMAMTRGAISKIAKRLLGKGLVESHRLQGNNKELHFRLTDSGARVFAEHTKCHAAARSKKLSLLEAYSPAEQMAVLRFLTEVGKLQENKMKQERRAADEETSDV